MVSYVLLRKLFSRSSYFFLLEKLFWRKFSAFRFCSCFVYGSCIWGISEKKWNDQRWVLRLICIWFVHRTQKSKINLLYLMFSWENYFHEVHIFLLEKLFWRKFSAFRFCSCFMYGSCIGQKSEDPEDLSGKSVDLYTRVFSRVSVWLCICSWCLWRPWRLL